MKDEKKLSVMKDEKKFYSPKRISYLEPMYKKKKGMFNFKICENIARIFFQCLILYIH